MMTSDQIPCSLSARERSTLQRWAAGRQVVEAGALLGGSTVALARVAASVVSIDRHRDYTVPTLRQFLSNLDRCGVGSRVRAVVGEAVSLLPTVAAEVAFIDLTGEFELTRQALLATRAPIALVHDLGRVHCHGVDAAIRAVGGRVIEHIDTLAVVDLTRVAA